MIKKACKRIFVICNLKRSGIEPHVLFHVYRALIRSCILYAYPCFCNASGYLHESMYKIERRVLRMIFHRSSHEESIQEVCTKLCRSLFQNVKDVDSHPLRSLFDARDPTPRNSSILRPPKAKTVRYSKSFIKFGR